MPGSARATSSAAAKSYVVRANGRVENAEDIGNIVLTSKSGVPVFLKDVAEIGVGRELRTGSASQNGNEVVVGTAMMLKGGNSRIVAVAVDEKMTSVNKRAAAGHRRQARAQPHQAGRCDHRHGRHEPGRRRAAGDCGAVPAAGQFPGGTDHGARHPDHACC